MKKMMLRLWKEEDGFIISMELVLIATILVIGLVSGMAQLRDQLNAELADVGGAIGGLDQTFALAGETAGDGSGTPASGWTDAADSYDIPSGGSSDTGAPGLTVSSVTVAAGTEGVGS
jgi:Flp pilus assembly pilin Flp